MIIIRRKIEDRGYDNVVSFVYKYGYKKVDMIRHLLNENDFCIMLSEMPTIGAEIVRICRAWYYFSGFLIYYNCFANW